MMKSLTFVVLMLLSGCAPFVSYDHMSDPRIANDGFDLVCGGAQVDAVGLEWHAGVCKDLSGFRNEYAKAGFRKVWNEK